MLDPGTGPMEFLVAESFDRVVTALYQNRRHSCGWDFRWRSELLVEGAVYETRSFDRKPEKDAAKNLGFV